MNYGLTIQLVIQHIPLGTLTKEAILGMIYVLVFFIGQLN